MGVGRRATAVRWGIVAALVAVLAALPSVIGALPASDSGVSAPELRARVLASDGVGFSGYAESAGGLALPVTDQLTSVADLLSARTTMRVWWRSPADNRVDVVTATGETGTHRDASGTWTWDYESATATRTAATPLDLPAPPDLLPSSLGRRLLSEAADGELHRIGARRVAGRAALGVRLTPGDPASSVSRVDLWVDGRSGGPPRVQGVGGGGGAALGGRGGGGARWGGRVRGRGARRAALDTRFLDLELARPAASLTAFTPPPRSTVREGRTAEVVLEAGERLRPVPLPGELAGLPRRRLEGAPSAIGLYGRGVTLLAVAPVPPRLAGGLRDALARSPGAVVDESGIRLSVGPMGLMLVEPPGRGPYVLTGTVTTDALAAAAAQLPELGERP